MDALVSIATTDRVRRHTAAHVNEKIDRRTDESLRSAIDQGPDAVVARLEEIDREWNVDRALMANFAVLGAATFELGKRVHPAWHYVLRGQMAFLLLHAVVGWCPPLAVFRRLGFRTAKEIEAERAALLQRI